MLKSEVCKYDQLMSYDFQKWADHMKEEKNRIHRKPWEWFYICQALSERGMLTAGKKGLGFAVGTEPLSSMFATFGCHILATDLGSDEGRSKEWASTNQHANELEDLNKRNICNPELFLENVAFRAVDMNNIPDDLKGFDFLWSSCSIEHLGSIKLGKEFVYKAMDCLEPGGIAVHTTEFNVTSNDRTADNCDSNIFRKRDMLDMAADLIDMGYKVEPLDFTMGSTDYDTHIDIPPYKQEVHLKLLLGGFVTTSIGIIITK
jgi:2-polyprenyl-3-methyl-5-hydroxy-6-metoxy-1,4-benzoquinol methylase